MNIATRITQVLLLALSLQATAQPLNSLEFITEAYPPYNFESDGIVRGIGADLLVAASSKANSPVARSNISLQPWARGYRSALNKDNICLFSTTRTDAREDKFKWAGPIAKTRIVVIARKESNLSVSNANGLNKLKLGAIRDDVGEQLLKEQGVSAGQIELSAKATSMVEKLKYRRIDGIAYEENVARWFIRNNGLSNSDYEVIYVLKEGELYYAFSNSISDDVVEQLQDGIDKVKSAPGQVGDTLYDDIVKEYL